MNRTGEQGSTPTRNSRFLKKNGYWYYTTREGMEVGPFDTQSEAESGVSAYIDFILHAEPCVIQKLSYYRCVA